ncbi:putative succinoglycan biosynthesis transport protein exoP [Magnetospirillum gryphiswaldense MSR-1 v2]|uniref:non-specific protein-tyrosine kinase n=1 Tax=Magnetospirillum gryphiswaldense (strain DSM 6361 / JCM 21280 / NBRC 15271 / MSR-1) TaxID=431944 RepID=V6EXI5_MAGGM|nr:putative succinoglycan biosynthesis transport protein exoP [Magnetospirillum gryphiswaldense MSR-1 v2]
MKLYDSKSAQDSPDLFRRQARRALGVVGRGKWVVLGWILIVTVPTVFYLYKAERRYTAQVEVLIEAPDIGDNLLERSYGKSRLTEASVQTEADILSSSVLVEKVIDKLGLERDPEFNTALRPVSMWAKAIGYINPLPVLTGQRAGEQQLSAEGRVKVERARIQGMFLSRLSVKSHRRSFVITAEFVADNGEKAARIANTLANLYVLERLEASLQDSKRANEWLAQRLDELRRDVATAEQAAEQFRSKYNLAQRRRGERQMTVNDQQLVELNSRLVVARSELAQKQARYDQLRGLLRNGGSMETAYDVLQSQLIQRLREQQVGKERELSEAMKTYGDRHPRIIGLRADLHESQARIAQEISKVAASLATETEAARVGVSSLERQIGQLQQGTNESGVHEVELRELERQAETSRTLYEAFLSRYKRDSEQESIQRANARVLSPAAIPIQPSSPRRVRIFLASLLLSVFGGIGLVFLLDRLNGRIRSAEEVEQITYLPLLAVIPKQGGKKRDAEALAFGILNAPRSPLANAFRSLKAVLAASAVDRGDKVTLITSSIPSEGKSFITRNLAMAVAVTGSRVLVIDGDLMRPTQHVALQREPSQGLTQLLSDASLSPEQLILRDERGGFDILPAGPVDAFSGNALSNGRLTEVLQSLSARYDRIFIDAPPSLATTDVQVLTQVADQIVFVVKWNDTPRDAIMAALSYLAKVGAEVSGVVLSQTSPAHHRKGAYGAYGYYGAYEGYGKNT